MEKGNMVSLELLTELQTIIEEDYGPELSMQAVSEIGNELVGFFELLLKIQSHEEANNEI